MRFARRSRRGLANALAPSGEQHHGKEYRRRDQQHDHRRRRREPRHHRARLRTLQSQQRLLLQPFDLALTPASASRIEAAYDRALKLSRELGLRSLELRAACSLA